MVAKEPKMPSFSTGSSRNARFPKLSAPGFTRRVFWWRPLIILVMIFILGFAGGWLGARSYNHSQPALASTAAHKQFISNESDLISSIAKSAGTSVVSIDSTQTVTTPGFFGLNTTSQEAAGTGFIISSDGTIVTNRHVVPSGTSKVSITLADGTRYDDVQVIGRTSDSSPLDIAFLKIGNLQGKKLTPLMLGDSAKMEVGDKVIAIGNALGQFQNTVTSGIISGYGRDVVAGDETGSAAETLTDLFQTDAAINEGNSGGPLMNINGEVIGINTAIAGGAQNIGFAIPINDVKGLVTSVLGKGKLEQPYLGVRYISLTDDLAYEYNLSVKRGAYVAPTTDGQPSILPGSPAEQAGLQEKDIITKVNNLKIDDKTSLSSALSRLNVGDQLNLTVVRGNKTIHLKATLGNTPS
jgi:serine protease Do